jgi:hypothetical protein
MGISAWRTSKRKISAICGAIIVATTALTIAASTASTYTVSVTDDAFTSSANPATTFWSQSYMNSATNSSSGSYRAYMRFTNVPSGPFASASLTIKALGANPVVDVYKVSDFGVYSINWNNQPALPAAKLGQISATSGAQEVAVPLDPTQISGGTLAIALVNPSSTIAQYAQMNTGYIAKLNLGTSASTTSTTSAAPPVSGPAVRINAGGGAYTDKNGNVWSADAYFNAGKTDNQAAGHAISGTNDPALFQDERYSPMTYNIPVSNGTYDVNLYFAEIYSGCQFSGCRQFNVDVNGSRFLSNFDIFAKVGGYAADKESTSATVSNGTLSIAFSAVKEQPEVVAIEVIPTGSTPSPSTTTTQGAPPVTTTTTRASTTTTQGAPPVTTTTTRATTTTAGGPVGSGRPPAGGYRPISAIAPVGTSVSSLPSDSQCAAQVHRSTWEPRSANNTPNHTVPPSTYHVGNFDNENSTWNSTYRTRITGNFTGTTDEIIQWVACKWGWSDELIRAEAVSESQWYQADYSGGIPVRNHGFGDYESKSSGHCVYDAVTDPCPTSYGIIQVRWYYHNHGYASTDPQSSYPWITKSTAFNLDLQAAEMRGCYEGLSWMGSQTKGDVAGCIQSWYSGSWTAGGSSYWQGVQSHYNNKEWLSW